MFRCIHYQSSNKQQQRRSYVLWQALSLRVIGTSVQSHHYSLFVTEISEILGMYQASSKIYSSRIFLSFGTSASFPHCRSGSRRCHLCGPSKESSMALTATARVDEPPVVQDTGDLSNLQYGSVESLEWTCVNSPVEGTSCAEGVCSHLTPS